MRSLLPASFALVLLTAVSCVGPGPTPEPKASDPKTSEAKTADAPSDAAVATAAQADAGDDSATTASAAPPAASDTMRVIEAGADPKAARAYAFVANKVDKRLVTVKQEQVQNGAGGQSLTLSMQIDFTPKKLEPKSTHFELKVGKVDMTQPPGMPAAQKAELTQALAGLTGLTGGFDVSPRGEVGDVSMQSDPKMQNPLAEGVVEGLSQVTEILVPLFPDAPIGVGAKWERTLARSDGGVKQTSTATYVLKEVNAEGGLIETDVEIKVPPRGVQGPNVPPGTSVSADGKGKYTYRFRFDRLATKVTGEITIKQHIDAIDGSGKRQSIDQTQVAKQTIDTVK